MQGRVPGGGDTDRWPRKVDTAQVVAAARRPVGEQQLLAEGREPGQPPADRPARLGAAGCTHRADVRRVLDVAVDATHHHIDCHKLWPCMARAMLSSSCSARHRRRLQDSAARARRGSETTRPGRLA
jgi:hypothetical protein